MGLAKESTPVTRIEDGAITAAARLVRKSQVASQLGIRESATSLYDRADKLFKKADSGIRNHPS